MDTFPTRSTKCISQPPRPKIPLAQQTSHYQRAKRLQRNREPKFPSQQTPGHRSVDWPVTQNHPRKEILEGDESTRLLQQRLNFWVYKVYSFIVQSLTKKSSVKMLHFCLREILQIISSSFLVKLQYNISRFACSISS